MNKRLVYKLSLIASIGGFLFGFDTAVISGTIEFVNVKFQLNIPQQGWYVSCALVGTMIGVIFAGSLSERYGRKNMLIISSVFFGLSAVGCMLIDNFQTLVIYRLLGGIGVGMASLLSPLYISEIAPAHIRGRLVSVYQFSITFGILIAYFTNSLFLYLSTSQAFSSMEGVLSTIFVSEVWRIMLGSEIIPASLFLVLLLTIPKSPRWLTLKGKDNEAKKILSKIVGKQEANKELTQLKELLDIKSEGLNVLLKSGFKVAVLVGIFLAVSTQLSGICAIIYYGPSILKESGLGLEDALSGQILIGLVNSIFTFVAIWKIDQFGRKKLLLYGTVGILFSLTSIGILFYFNILSTFLLISLLLIFVASFAFSYGPVTWVLLSELYPTNIRGFAMSIGTISLWIGSTFVSQLTPWFFENLKPHGTFWFFAFCMLPSLYVIIKILPETKGKTLEEIESYWLNKNKL